jgi:hypothetical protein
MAAMTPNMDLSVTFALSAALRSCGTAECLSASQRLLAVGRNGPVTVHLRQAGIDAAATGRLATALASVSDVEAARLISFSLSYNAIGDDGAIALSKALPASLPDLGLVGCGLNDIGMLALLDWAKAASGLRMICIEGNQPSDRVRAAFRALAQSGTGPMVYV